MIRRLTMAALACVLVAAGAAPALAVQTPKPGGTDARVRMIDYDPLQVVRITGVYRTATQVLFGDDETILHVAVGDTTAWDVAAEKNILFIKPKAGHGLTDLIVTTALPGGAARNYIFELTMGRRAGGGGLYVLRFRYPADVKAAARAAISAQEQALIAKITALKLERGAVEGRRNLAYDVQGAPSLQPSEVSDNGRFTVLRFPAGQPIPAIYQVLPDGAEALVPFDVRGEFVVIHATAKQFRLRRGRDVLCIYDKGQGSPAAGLGTNTAAPDVDRTDIGQTPPKPSKPGEARP